jgi:CubicO group peptidase (beta-lactamase class C family)
MARIKVAATLFLILCVVPGLALAAAPSDPFSRSPSSPEAEGVDPELLLAMMAVIEEQNARQGSPDTIDSVIIIRHGNVVLEAYPTPSYSVASRHHLFSVTKSITSLLVGIALDLGLIGSVTDPILSYFPDVVPLGEVQSKSAITIEHLLTMSAGLEWDEDTLPTSDPRNDFTRLEMSADPIGFVLRKPVIAQPGALFWYNSGLSEALSALIAEVSGQTTLTFANEHLFGPLGIEEVRWNRDRAGVYKGGTQLFLTPRDLAKIGVLCLNDGVWDGEEIVSSDWLAQSTQTRIRGRPNYFAGRGYAYHWWTLDEYGVYYASGSQGQCLYVFPEMDLVVVFTGTIQRGEISPEKLAREFILPAIVATE